MRKAFIVARREYVANVRTKSFIVGILFLPILLLASVFLPSLFQKMKGETRRFSVVDPSGESLAAIEKALEAGAGGGRPLQFALVPPSEFGGTPDEQREAMKKAVEEDRLFAMAEIGPGALEDGSGCSYLSKSAAEEGLLDFLSRTVTTLYRERFLARANLEPEVVKKANATVWFQERLLSKEGGEKETTKADKVGGYASLGFVYLLWMSIFMMAQGLLTSTIEEKSNRTVEVVLSSCTPFDFMSGKVLGLAAVGLTLVGTWITCFFLFFQFVAPAISETLASFDIGAILGNPVNLSFFAVFFLLGYLLYASIFCGIGSVCTTLTEAQNLIGPVTLILMIPLLSMFHTVKNPDSTLSTVLSWVPFFTPFVMMNRVAAVPPPSGIEVAASVLWLLLWVYLVMRGAAKVFRIGVLLYGKPPKLREILRWARAR